MQLHIQEFSPEELLGPLNSVERKHAPATLYLAGNADLIRKGVRVSVVGSRKASEDGIRRTIGLSRVLAENGLIVVSGLAEGVDAAAHRTVMAVGGQTIGVLGTPLDKAYPAKNRPLQEKMAEEHLLVSQFMTGRSTHKGSFPMRNRTMALLTSATIIVEAGEQSGTLHQGWEALRLGRLLFFLESVVSNHSLSWPAKMIEYGAQVLTKENLTFLLEELPVLGIGEPILF